VTTFIEGEPALFLTPKEKDWRSKVRVGGFRASPNLAMRFDVRSFRRGGNPFDIDNLAKPVLDELQLQPETIWVLVQVSASPGLTLSRDAPPPAPDSAVQVSVQEPRGRSVKPIVPMPEIVGLSLIGNGSEPVGLALYFDSAEVPIWDFGFEGPIKPFIDGLGPLLGPAPQGPADHRIRELRITRGSRPGQRGARIRMWLLD